MVESTTIASNTASEDITASNKGAAVSSNAGAVVNNPPKAAAEVAVTATVSSNVAANKVPEAAAAVNNQPKANAAAVAANKVPENPPKEAAVSSNAAAAFNSQPKTAATAEEAPVINKNSKSGQPVINKNSKSSQPVQNTLTTLNVVQKEPVSDNVITQWVILLVFCCIPFLVYTIAPSYGNTIANAAYWTIATFAAIMCIITAISIMMNIYKSDGTAIMVAMGLLGSFVAPFIVIIYTVYHIYGYAMSIKPRPYFGLFPFGIYGPEGSFFDSILAPFHDTSKEKGFYDSMISDAKSILYGQPRV